MPKKPHPLLHTFTGRKRLRRRRKARHIGGRTTYGLMSRLPIPLKMRVVLHQKTAWQIKPAIGASNGYIQYIANNCYQPFSLAAPNVVVSSPGNIVHANGNVDGDMPNCFTNYCSATALYRYYRVLHTRCLVKTEGIATSDQGIRLCISPTPSILSTFGSYKTACQAMYARETRNYSNRYSPVSVSNQLAVWKHVGLSKNNVLYEEDYNAIYNSSPQSQPSWQIDFTTSDDAVPAANFYISIETTQLVQLEYPNYVGASD